MIVGDLTNGYDLFIIRQILRLQSIELFNSLKVTIMKISEFLADEAILTELGERFARYRIDLQLTQAEVAEQAGISKRTVERIEAGASAQLSSIIRLLRVLDLLPGLETMLPESEASPMALLKQKGKVRKRVSSRRVDQVKEPQPWAWGDDT